MQYANAKASTNQHSHLVCPLVIQRNPVVWWLSGTQSCLCPAPTPHRQRRSTSAKLCLHCEMQNSYLCVPRGEPPYRCKGRGRGLIKSTFSAEKRTSAVATSSFSYFYFILSEWHYHPDPISHMERVKDGNFDIILRFTVTLNTKLLGKLFIVHTKSTNLGYLKTCNVQHFFFVIHKFIKIWSTLDNAAVVRNVWTLITNLASVIFSKT